MSTQNAGAGAAGAAGTTTTTEGGAGTAAGTAAGAGTAAAGEEYKNMSPEAFKARLEAERAAGERATLKALGVEKIDDAKTRLAEDQKRRDAEKTELQKAQEAASTAETLRKENEKSNATIKRLLEVETKAIPEAKKSLLDLAPPETDPVARLDWIAKAKANGLFADAATTTTQAANTRAGGNPPPAANAGTKHPRDMTPAEYAVHKAKVLAGPET